MIRYDKYKPSGVEWLGEIPEHWEVKRVKDFGEYQSGYFIDANEFDNNNDYPVFGGNGIRSYASKHNHNGEYILIGRQGALCGNINIAKGKFWATEHAVVVYNKSNINKKWYAFLLEVMNLNQYAISAAQPGLSVDKVKRLMLPYISLPEQIAIANYLDTKTVAIDQKIELLTAKTAKYNALRRSLINETVCRGLNPNVPLKDSGIEWIGKIPAHWEVKRFKDVVAKYTTGGTPTTSNTDYFEGNNIWVCISDISESAYIYDSKIKLTDEAIRSLNIIKTPKGSLLFSFKLSIGKIAFVEKSVYTNEAILSIFPNKNIDLKYYYFMLPIFMLLAATENIYGAKMLNQKLIANALVVHPSIEEQSIIAEHLENKTAQIDTILTNISNQINKLKQLRKTLINGVVTGKIKVTED